MGGCHPSLHPGPRLSLTVVQCKQTALTWEETPVEQPHPSAGGLRLNTKWPLSTFRDALNVLCSGHPCTAPDSPNSHIVAWASTALGKAYSFVLTLWPGPRPGLQPLC